MRPLILLPSQQQASFVFIALIVHMISYQKPCSPTTLSKEASGGAVELFQLCELHFQAPWQRTCQISCIMAVYLWHLRHVLSEAPRTQGFLSQSCGSGGVLAPMQMSTGWDAKLGHRTPLNAICLAQAWCKAHRQQHWKLQTSWSKSQRFLFRLMIRKTAGIQGSMAAGTGYISAHSRISVSTVGNHKISVLKKMTFKLSLVQNESLTKTNRFLPLLLDSWISCFWILLQSSLPSGGHYKLCMDLDGLDDFFQAGQPGS